MARGLGKNRRGFANSSVISSKTIGTESIPGPTSDSDFYIASDSATGTQHKIIHISNNKVVAGWIDGSNYPYVAVGSVGTDGTTTWGTPSAVNGTTTSVDIDLVHLADDKFMVLYDEGGSLSSFASDHYLYGKVGSISSTTVSSYGTAVRLDLDYNSTYRGLDRDSSAALFARKNIYSAVRIEEDKVFLGYRRSFAFGGRILTVSGTTITLASHFNIMSDGRYTARNIRCAVSPENGNNIVVFHSFNAQGTQGVKSYVVSGTSVSGSSTLSLSEGTGGSNTLWGGIDEDAFDICWINASKFAITERLVDPSGSDGKNRDDGGSYPSGYSEGDVVVGVFEFNGTSTIGSTGGFQPQASIVATNSDSGARLARLNDTKIAAIYRNDDDSNTLYYRIGTLGGSDAIVWDTAVDTNLSGAVGFISITKNIRSSDARAILFVKTATALTGGHADNAVSSSIQGFDTVVTYSDTKFLSSIWSLKDQNKKMSKGEWIRNDTADTGVDGKGRSIKGSGLAVFGHRHYSGPGIIASGGNEVTTPTHTYHVFTSPGTFNMTGAQGQVEYLVVGGGGHGGPGSGWNDGRFGGGGGAGGVRQGFLDPLTPGAYPITVGAGGGTTIRGSQWSPSTAFSPSYNGSPSSFATVTAAGGGAGGRPSPSTSGQDGGSGGGAGNGNNSYGSGNTPPTSPPQGNPGGGQPNSHPSGATVAGGGGGAGGAGVPGQGGGHGGLGLFFPQFAGTIIGPAIHSGGTVNGVGTSDMLEAVTPLGFYGAGGGGAALNGSHPLRRGGGGPTGASNLPYDGNSRYGVSHGAIRWPSGGRGSHQHGYGAGHGGGGAGDETAGLGGNGIVIIRYLKR